MIKLNNRGFAVSTILYGILSLTILILMLIFGIMKSSKDMNQDLVQSLEERMNKCVLSEIKLEECYLDGGNCDVTEYNNCLGKESKSYVLAEKAKIGDFVDYDAGTWPITEEIPKSDYSMGGYKAGSSRNNSVNCNGDDNNLYNGWRVSSINGETVTLIHAGTPGCYYHSRIEQQGYRGYHFLTGNLWNSNFLAPLVYDWSIYVNSAYATSARMSSSSDFNEAIRNINASYFWATVGACDHNECLMGVYKGSGPNNAYGLMGIRPVVTLKEGIKTGGSITNTYGVTEWILVK